MPSAPNALAPGEASERTGLSLDTLRYYEREGLIGPIGRHAGQRSYTEDDIAWIGLVTCLRNAGLGIDDLRRFTRLLRSQADPTDRVTFLTERREELRDQLRRIEAAIEVLGHKIDYYRDRQY